MTIKTDEIPFVCDDSGCEARCPTCSGTLHPIVGYVFCENSMNVPLALTGCLNPIRSFATEEQAAQWLEQIQRQAHAEYLKLKSTQT